MGEKIRDIRPIKIGKTTLMVELNEGYTASQGRLIHIQNKKFRYLLTEHDFYHLASMVLRSWSEFNYIKNNPVLFKRTEEFDERENISNETNLLLKKICDDLSSLGIEYRILDVQNSLITILIKEEFLKVSKTYFSQKFKQYFHPYGTINHYHFLYQMKEFLLYRNEQEKNVEIYFQLPCASITPKTWIPLDRIIQQHLWDGCEIIDGLAWADISCRFIFHLCWSIFHNKGFSPYAKKILASHKDCLETEEMGMMLEAVFFNFTPSLKRYILDEDFDSIITNYYSFKEY